MAPPHRRTDAQLMERYQLSESRAARTASHRARAARLATRCRAEVRRMGLNIHQHNGNILLRTTVGQDILVGLVVDTDPRTGTVHMDLSLFPGGTPVRIPALSLSAQIVSKFVGFGDHAPADSWTFIRDTRHSVSVVAYCSSTGKTCRGHLTLEHREGEGIPFTINVAAGAQLGVPVYSTCSNLLRAVRKIRSEESSAQTTE